MVLPIDLLDDQFLTWHPKSKECQGAPHWMHQTRPQQVWAYSTMMDRGLHKGTCGLDYVDKTPERGLNEVPQDNGANQWGADTTGRDQQDISWVNRACQPSKSTVSKWLIIYQTQISKVLDYAPS